MPTPTLNSSVRCSTSGGSWAGSIVVASSLTNSCLVLIGNVYDGGGTPTFTLGSGGTAFTLFHRRVEATGRTAGIWRIINPTAGTYTLTQTAGSLSGNLRALVWVDVDQTTPLANAAGIDILTGSPTISGLTLPTNGVLIDCFGNQNNDGQCTAPTSPQTQIGIDGDGSTFNNAATSYKTSGTSMGWSSFSTEGAYIAAAIQYAAGGGGTVGRLVGGTLAGGVLVGGLLSGN